ncbi:MAG: hypothetical protein NTU53_07685 [Planctomycetota bacterium]|nr:hypothetical protein [Planctomycetota bacterium]
MDSTIQLLDVVALTAQPKPRRPPPVKPLFTDVVGDHTEPD